MLPDFDISFAPLQCSNLGVALCFGFSLSFFFTIFSFSIGQQAFVNRLFQLFFIPYACTFSFTVCLDLERALLV